jgi:uncharacterized SAM-binding protein YcdF (DUF218 family)
MRARHQQSRELLHIVAGAGMDTGERNLCFKPLPTFASTFAKVVLRPMLDHLYMFLYDTTNKALESARYAQKTKRPGALLSASAQSTLSGQ